MKPIVQIENLSHRYNIQWAVRDINMEILERGVYGLLGSNGAGKSTAMNILCGVLKPTGGRVVIKGIDMRKHPVEAKRHIGFLPQRPPLHADLTVEEYLHHAASVRMMPRQQIASAAREVMERCGLTHFRRRLTRNLSGGYQQRLGIAQAIIHRPAFVVLDEPTNGLDPNQIMEIRHLIKSIAEEHTVLLSTHILSEVQATCQHVRMIEEGQLVFSGSVDDFDNYIVPSSLLVSMIDAPPIDDLLRVPGVLGVEALGGVRYRVKFSENPSEHLVEASVANGWRLTAIDVEKSSLDVIFSALSRKQR